MNVVQEDVEGRFASEGGLPKAGACRFIMTSGLSAFNDC